MAAALRNIFNDRQRARRHAPGRHWPRRCHGPLGGGARGGAGRSAGLCDSAKRSCGIASTGDIDAHIGIPAQKLRQRLTRCGLRHGHALRPPCGRLSRAPGLRTVSRQENMHRLLDMVADELLGDFLIFRDDQFDDVAVGDDRSKKNARARSGSSHFNMPCRVAYSR